MFILYLLLPTGFLLLQATLLDWQTSWVLFLLNETLTLLMFMHIGSTFSPLNEVFMTRSFDGSYTRTE